jgi:hypothetical protein
MLGLGFGHRDLYMTRGGAVNGPHLPKPMILWASPKRPSPSAFFPFFSHFEQIVFLNLNKKSKFKQI